MAQTASRSIVALAVEAAVACALYAAALGLAAVDDAGLVSKAVRAWIAALGSVAAGAGLPLASDAHGAPAWRGHLAFFCALVLIGSLARVRPHVDGWRRLLAPMLRQRSNAARLVWIKRGCAQMALGALAVLVALAFPAEIFGSSAYFFVAPIEAGLAVYFAAWFLVFDAARRGTDPGRSDG